MTTCVYQVSRSVVLSKYGNRPRRDSRNRNRRNRRSLCRRNHGNHGNLCRRNHGNRRNHGPAERRP